MPCDSSHCEPTGIEREMTKVLLITDEAATGTHVNQSDYNSGTHSEAYNAANTRPQLDAATAVLCSVLRAKNDTWIRHSSLELQLWFRDHCNADTQKSLLKEVATFMNNPDRFCKEDQLEAVAFVLRIKKVLK